MSAPVAPPPRFEGVWCQEVFGMIGNKPMHCRQPAVCVIWHRNDERAYPMCLGCGDHNARNRGGVVLAAEVGFEDVGTRRLPTYARTRRDKAADALADEVKGLREQVRAMVEGPNYDPLEEHIVLGVDDAIFAALAAYLMETR